MSEKRDGLKIILVGLVFLFVIGFVILFGNEIGMESFASNSVLTGRVILSTSDFSSDDVDSAFCWRQNQGSSDCTSEVSSSDNSGYQIDKIETGVDGFVNASFNFSIFQGSVSEVLGIFEWQTDSDAGEGNVSWHYWDGSSYQEEVGIRLWR